MTRVKRGKTKLKRRKKTLSQVKGYRFGRSTKKRQAYEAIVHAGNHAFAHRKDKKSDMRRLWQIKINAALRMVFSHKFASIIYEDKQIICKKIKSD